jgi:hypothetical protein
MFQVLALNLMDKTLLLYVAIGLVCFLVVDKLLALKHHIDTVQFKANQAGGVAASIGFKLFDDLLHWAGAGNVKETRRIVKELWEKYCQDNRGPMLLARDVFMCTWAKLRSDPEFGNEVRQEVVHEALGIDINDKTDLVAAGAGERASRIGWPHISKMANAWATREWRDLAPAVKGLFDEFMEADGEKKIAARVAKPTLSVLWDDPKYHADAVALVREFAKKADAEDAAKKAETVAMAKALIASGETL